MQEAVARTAEATDQRVVKPIVHQAQHAAAETRDFLNHLVRRHREAVCTIMIDAGAPFGFITCPLDMS